MQLSDIKLILVGNDNVGKSTWVDNLRTDEIDTKYISTAGIEVHPIRLITNCGDEILFKVWDCTRVRNDYYINSDCAIIMDSTPNSGNFDKWEERINLNIPKLRVLSKGDLLDVQEQHDCDVILSTYDDSYVLEPLIQLARTLLRDNTLEFELFDDFDEILSICDGKLFDETTQAS